MLIKTDETFYEEKVLQKMTSKYFCYNQ